MISPHIIILALLISIISIIVILYVFKKLGGKRPLVEIILNNNGYPTLSKFQFLLWTLVLAFTFFSIHIIMIIETSFPTQQAYSIQSIPENLLALMGISVAVPVISTIQSARTKITKKSDKSFGSMFLNSEGRLDLAKLQMFLWTIIGILIYLYIVVDELVTVSTVNELFLPDISPTLLILMGLSHGAYLGSKLTGQNQPKEK